MSFLIILTTLTAKSQIITSVVPDSGTQCQKLTLTVTGENTNFYQGTSILWLEMGYSDINPTTTTVISSTQIEGEFYFNPEHAVGIYDVHAYNGGGSGDMVLPESFTLSAVADIPQLISLSPDVVQIGESTVISIVGQHTHFSTDGIYNSVWLTSTDGGYLTGTSVTVIDSLHLEANLVIPYFNPAGSYILHVNNPLDGEMLLPDALTVLDNPNDPEIVLVDPNLAQQGEGLTITVTATETNFLQGSSILRLHNNGSHLTPNNYNVLNDTVIEGYFEFNHNHDTGYYDVKVMNWLLEDLILEDGFHLLGTGEIPAVLWSIPDSAYMGSRATLLIKTENTHFNSNNNIPSVTLKYEFEELYCKDITVVDSVTLEAGYIFSYDNRTEIKDLIVESPLDGTIILENAFYIIEREPNASIVNVNPDSAFIGDLLTINVTGKNIIFMQGTSNLSLKQGSLSIAPINQEILNDTTISGEFDFLNTFPIGKYDVNIDNWYAWPAMNLTDGFTLELFDFMDESDKLTLLTVYPNPSNGLLTIKRNFNNRETYYISVYNQLGITIYENELLSDEFTKQLDLTHITPGTYYLNINGNSNEHEESKQIVIQ